MYEIPMLGDIVTVFSDETRHKVFTEKGTVVFINTPNRNFLIEKIGNGGAHYRKGYRFDDIIKINRMSKSSGTSN